MTDLKDKLLQRLRMPLPGEQAHFMLAPEHRQKELDEARQGPFNPKLSAVILLLYKEADAYKLVFIRRSDYVGIHAGQIAFAGGRYEESDIDLQHTALREVEEEIGIPRNQIEILGPLTDLYVPPSNFLVRPFVGYLNTSPAFTLDPREVKSIHTIDLDELMQPGVVDVDYFASHRREEPLRAPCYKAGGITIWGASAMILSEFLEIITQ